jgi:hypothetical protein
VAASDLPGSEEHLVRDGVRPASYCSTGTCMLLPRSPVPPLDRIWSDCSAEIAGARPSVAPARRERVAA